MTDLLNEEGRAPMVDAAFQTVTEKRLDQKPRDDHAAVRAHLAPLFDAGMDLIPLKRRSKEPVGKWRDTDAMNREAASSLLAKGVMGEAA